MSSFYVLEEKGVDVSGKADSSYVNDEIAKLRTHSDNEDKKLLDLAGTRPMTDDLILVNKAILGTLFEEEMS